MIEGQNMVGEVLECGHDYVLIGQYETGFYSAANCSDLSESKILSFSDSCVETAGKDRSSKNYQRLL